MKRNLAFHFFSSGKAYSAVHSLKQYSIAKIIMVINSMVFSNPSYDTASSKVSNKVTNRFKNITNTIKKSKKIYFLC